MCFLKSTLIVTTVYFTTAICVINFNSGNGNLNPEIFLNSTQLLQRFNYSSKSYRIITEDGYHLKLIRIVSKGPPILLAHGFSDSSDSWIVQGPQYSLACKLADKGYDVWLFNARGNRYSKGHSKNLNEKEYWNFSYEEIGVFDLSATVDFILSKTMRRKLTFIGFSQGTTAFFVLCSLKPEYNYKFNHAIILAPVAWFDSVEHPLVKLLNSNLNALKSTVEKEGIYQLFPFNEQFSLYHANVCNLSSPKSWLCAIEVFLSAGLENLSQLIPERLPVITSHMPAGFSVKTLIHYVQGYSSKRFERYNVGPKKNRKIYFSSTPPEYNVSQISVPMSIFFSENDWFSSIKSFENLQNNLRAPYETVILNKSLQFTHLEFVYGTRAMSLINEPVMDIVKGLQNV